PPACVTWDMGRRQALPVGRGLGPGGREACEAALRRAHAKWVAVRPAAQNDPATWNRLWPFQSSDNFAFTDQGIVVKYNSYELAPYSYGQPELLIPYSELSDVLRVDYLPSQNQ